MATKTATRKSSKKKSKTAVSHPSFKSIKEIQIEKLRFDLRNPRLPDTLDKRNTESLIKWMLRETSIIELMIAIGEKGFFPGEPLLVCPSSQRGFYDVIEGNRRLCAVKLLSEPQLATVRQSSITTISTEAKFRPKKLPAIIYQKREHILNYLGYRHITGVKEWSALAKAKYLRDLRTTVSSLSPDEQFKSLARSIGSRTNYVRRLLMSLEIYRRIESAAFFGYDINENDVGFSLLTTALGYSNVVEYLGLERGDDPDFDNLNTENLAKLTDWMFVKYDGKTKLGESRQLSDLSAIIKSPKALAHFEAGYSLKNAVALTGEPLYVFRKAVNTAQNELSVANDTVYSVDGLEQTDSEMLLAVIKLGRQVKSLVDTKVSGEDED